MNHTHLANALRFLSIDSVNAAKSGHPGMPMGMADIATVLWRQHLQHNPANPHWFNRDRFVLSNGHGSMLLYALLHLSGYDLPLQELKNFRQLHSKTPGHPEYGLTPGVETTTGPLGQGLANAVGLALAEKLLANEFNQPDLALLDHYTYVFLGDGCLMEGVSHEACALAGCWHLGKLICFYDDNNISIDGEVQPWFRDNTPARFAAYGWQVIADIDGHDPEAIDAAIIRAQNNSQQPSIICCKTIIGKGAPQRAGTGKAHGEPLGAEETAGAREQLDWQHPPFEIPADIRQAWDQRSQGAEREQRWQQRWQTYQQRHPELAHEFERRQQQLLPANLDAIYAQARQQVRAQQEKIASRKASQNALEVFTAHMPELLGGSADLTGSNLTQTSHTAPLRFSADGVPNQGRHINYGVREFGMSAIANGIVLHGGYRPYVGTFLTFSDYARNAVRMAALMGIAPVFVYTHDSIGLGEDGPTHQAIEQLSSLRLIPNLDLWRPADSEETLAAWHNAIQRQDGPSALALSRQGLPYLPKAADAAIERGAYVISPASSGRAQALLLATGSEVSIALAAQKQMAEQHGAQVNVVSMPCTDVFARQSEQYQQQVLPAGLPRVAIEAGVSAYWHKYHCSAIIAIDCYGESAPAGELFEHYQLTSQQLCQSVLQVLQ